MPNLVKSTPIAFPPPLVENPQVIVNRDNWTESRYPVTIAPSGLVEVIRGDDGSTFIFISLQPSFGIGGGLDNTRDDVSFLDTVTIGLTPVQLNSPPVAFLNQQFIPLSAVNSVNYTFESGITIGGSIGLKGKYGSAKGGAEISLSAEMSYTSATTSFFQVGDVAINANLQGVGMTWAGVMQSVYDGSEARPYDPSNPHASIHKQPGNYYMTPPAACAGTYQLQCQGVWQVPQGVTGSLVFGVKFQARLIQGHADSGWGNTSSTWVAMPMALLSVDLGSGVLSLMDPNSAVGAGYATLASLALTGTIHDDGEKKRIDS